MKPGRRGIGVIEEAGSPADRTAAERWFPARLDKVRRYVGAWTASWDPVWAQAEEYPSIAPSHGRKEGRPGRVAGESLEPK